MAGLLSRIGMGVGKAMEDIGQSGIEEQREARLMTLRDKQSQAGEKRRSGIRTDEAIATEGRAESRAVAKAARETAERGGKSDEQIDLDRIEHQERMKAKYRAPTKADKEDTADAERIAEAKIKKSAKDLSNEIADGPLLFNSAVVKERFGNSKQRLKAEITDRLNQGWTPADIFKWVEDEKYTPSEKAETKKETAAPTGSSAESMIDKILDDKAGPGMPEGEVLEQILGTVQLKHLHDEAKARLGR